MRLIHATVHCRAAAAPPATGSGGRGALRPPAAAQAWHGPRRSEAWREHGFLRRLEGRLEPMQHKRRCNHVLAPTYGAPALHLGWTYSVPIARTRRPQRARRRLLGTVHLPPACARRAVARARARLGAAPHRRCAQGAAQPHRGARLQLVGAAGGALGRAGVAHAGHHRLRPRPLAQAARRPALLPLCATRSRAGGPACRLSRRRDHALPPRRVGRRRPAPVAAAAAPRRVARGHARIRSALAAQRVARHSQRVLTRVIRARHAHGLRMVWCAHGI
jgi:hypothetical protein